MNASMLIQKLAKHAAGHSVELIVEKIIQHVKLDRDDPELAKIAFRQILQDFTLAFVLVTLISALAAIWNLKFARDAGASMSGRRRER